MKLNHNVYLSFALLLTVFIMVGFSKTVEVTVSSATGTFSPASISVTTSDTINFTKLGSTHNAAEVQKSTFDGGGVVLVVGGFKTAFGGGLVTGLSTGTHYYQCLNHLSMKGQIIVESPSLNHKTQSTIQPANRVQITDISGKVVGEWNSTMPVSFEVYEQKLLLSLPVGRYLTVR